MLNLSLELFHEKIKDEINLIQVVTGIHEISNIIRACRLKPYDILKRKNKKSTSVYNHWIDEFGNSAFIYKNYINIIYGDLCIDKSKIISTDLYYGLSVSQISKISKSAYISYGIEEDFNTECVLLCMLGIDNYLRTYLYTYNKWEQISSLILGYHNLYKILTIQKNYFWELSKIKNIRMPCDDVRTWITSMKAVDKFGEAIDERFKFIIPILQGVG